MPPDIEGLSAFSREFYADAHRSVCWLIFLILWGLVASLPVLIAIGVAQSELLAAGIQAEQGSGAWL